MITQGTDAGSGAPALTPGTEQKAGLQSRMAPEKGKNEKEYGV